MRILYLAINYFPERTSVAPFNTGLCEHLVAAGHQVTVVTAFPYYPQWRVWDDYRGKVYDVEKINNVDVRRVLHFIPRRASSLIQRLVHDFSFSIAALGVGLFVQDYDVVCCSSPPPALALAAYVLAKIRGKQFVIKLTDLASDAALATGIIKKNTLVRAAQSVESFVYTKADQVVCLCHGFIEKLVARGIDRRKLPLISDWGDTERICPGPRQNSFRAAHGISPEQFVVLHTGNMGKKQDLMNLVRAAEITSDRRDVVWMIVGEGEERAYISMEAAKRKLPNLVLLPLQPAEILDQVYSCADVLLLNQKAAIRDSVIPSKLLTYLAAGRAVAAAVSVESESATLISAANCGVIVEPENPRALADAALALCDNQAYRELCGSNGRAYAERNFTRARVLCEYEVLLARYSAPRHTPVKKERVVAGAAD